MNRGMTVRFADLTGGAYDVSLDDALLAVSRMASEMAECARAARTKEMCESFLVRARMLRAIAYFAMPSVTRVRDTDRGFRASLEVDASVIAAYRGNGADIIDALLLDLRSDLLSRIARDSSQPPTESPTTRADTGPASAEVTR